MLGQICRNHLNALVQWRGRKILPLSPPRQLPGDGDSGVGVSDAGGSSGGSGGGSSGGSGHIDSPNEMLPEVIYLKVCAIC